MFELAKRLFRQNGQRKHQIDGQDVLCERVRLAVQSEHSSIPASSSIEANRHTTACFTAKVQDTRVIVEVHTTCMAMGTDAIDNTTQIRR